MQLGLIGYPLVQSRSPEIFARIFNDENIKGASYKLYPLEDVTVLHSWLKSVSRLNGFNVTIPHKKSIIPFLDSISPEAEAIGAINTVKINREGNTYTLYGYNTDYFAFKQTLQKFLGNAKPAKALILGTGGSSNTIAYVLKELGIEYVKVSRNSNNDALLTYEDVKPETIQHYKLIVNTTPLGMYPAIKSFAKLPYEALTSGHFLYDLVYNPVETVFLQKGKENGANTQTGIEMLELQAQKAWEIWKS